MSQKVLDSHALLAFFENEKGADKVAELIRQARDRDKPLLLTAVNWGEVLYMAARASGHAAAGKIEDIIDTLPIEIVPVDRAIAKLAAGFKAAKKMSYADCFAAALAKQKKADLITGDPEFKAVANEIHICWL
ncbi:MAG: type II toxin-antitoxin system VapC family toxin [Elusimicrobia bacterium]|nr:type II toxin-antitoxin system VapC family toxin [Elusimicrobiota bacterium]